jgi:apolipoprotein N-acyltransferase
MTLAIRLALSVLSAALMVLSVPTFNLWPLMWIGLLPALPVALAASTPRRAFLYGWFLGSVANTAAFYWMKGLLERFGHMPSIEAIPIMLLLTIYQGAEFGLWTWGVHRVARRRPGVAMTWVAPLVMIAIELLVPQIFPFYLAISQAFVPPVIQIADITGPMGVSFVMVMVTGALFEAGRDVIALRRRTAGDERGSAQMRAYGQVIIRRLRVPAAIVTLVLGYGVLRLHQVDARRAAAPKARVGIVQANVGISEKWDPGERGHLLRLHQDLSDALTREGADLIVWPESSYPYAIERDLEHDFPPGDPRRIRGAGSTPTLFGAITLAPEPRKGRLRYPFNTALMLDEGGRITGKFDKVFLLIFGEYIPFYDSIPWFTDLFPEASNFNRGESPGSFPFRLRGRDFRLGPLICYEDILPGFTRRTAALDPNLLVNITNDAWFGKTFEPYQHLALAVFRSVENRLEMVRAVNTGVSAHIDAGGRVKAILPAVDPSEEPPPRPARMLADAALLDRGGVYAHVGDAFAWACLLALVALVAGIPRRSRPNTEGAKTPTPSRRRRRR